MAVEGRPEATAFDLFTAVAVWTALIVPGDRSAAEENFKRAGGRAPYAHHVPLYDALDRRIDPKSDHPLPYSPRNTCKKCHDYAAISTGHHFNPVTEQSASDRPGQPWIWLHRQTGSQIPLSLSGWPGTYRPQELGLSDFDFIQRFGGYLCGGGLGEPLEPADRWAASGPLEIDCMICHAGGRSYRHESWVKQIEQGNFRWAATAAIGLAKVEGTAADGPRDAGDASAGGRAESPVKLVYDMARFDAAGEVFFDVVRRPDNGACYACHSVDAVGEHAPSRWLADHDVHLRAGMLCADCHGNGIEHQTVRGFDGESRGDGLSVTVFSCRGCHLSDESLPEASNPPDTLPGRWAAPKPAHRGLPPIHLERMSCTSCHCGPLPTATQQTVQTSMAHHLGVASQTRRDDDPPGIVQPVFIKDDQGMLRPYRMMWPAFWGWLDQDRILPADPESIHRTIRRTLRVRTDFQQELAAPPASTSGGDSAGDPAATFRKRIEASLKKLAEKPPREASEPVYLAGGKVYRLGDSGELVEQLGAREAAPYAWALGHDVRPARQSLGSRGCQECHAGGAPIFHSVVRAVGPAPDSQPIERPMHQWSGYDTALLAAWERLFRLRPLFKWSAAAALALLVALLLAMIMRGVQRLVVALSRRLLHGRGEI